MILDLCDKNNLRVFDIKKNDINGASKQYFICHKVSKYKENKKNIFQILDSERKFKLADEITFKKFIYEINLSKKN